MNQLSVRTRVLIGVAALLIGATYGWLTTSRDDTPEGSPQTAQTPSPTPTAEASAGPMDSATNVTWRLRSLLVRRGERVRTTQVEGPTLRFSDDGTFTADGCTTFMGTWDATGNAHTESVGQEGDGNCKLTRSQEEHLGRVLNEFSIAEQADILTLFGTADAKKLGAIYSTE